MQFIPTSQNERRTATSIALIHHYRTTDGRTWRATSERHADPEASSATLEALDPSSMQWSTVLLRTASQLDPVKYATETSARPLLAVVTEALTRDIDGLLAEAGRILSLPVVGHFLVIETVEHTVRKVVPASVLDDALATARRLAQECGYVRSMRSADWYQDGAPENSVCVFDLDTQHLVVLNDEPVPA